jgi:hypothetical protein
LTSVLTTPGTIISSAHSKFRVQPYLEALYQHCNKSYVYTLEVLNLQALPELGGELQGQQQQQRSAAAAAATTALPDS